MRKKEIKYIKSKVTTVYINPFNYTFEIKESDFEVYLTPEELSKHLMRVSREIQKLLEKGYKEDIDNVQ